MLMKKLVKLLLISLAFLSIGSCKKDKKGDVELEYPISFIDMMEIDTTNVDSFVIRESIDFPTALDGDLAKNNTSKDKIKSAKLVYLRLQVLDYAYADSAHYANLSDISELSMDIKKDGIGQHMVAHKVVPDARTKNVVMDLTDVELRDYIKQDNFRFVAKYKKRRAMPNQMPYSIVLKFKVIAEPL